MEKLTTQTFPELKERLESYCKIDTRSVAGSESTPSSSGQLELANLIKDELINFGIKNVEVDQYGVLYASIITDKSKPTIALIGHFDIPNTPNWSDEAPTFIENYSGEAINVNDNISLNSSSNPELGDCIGHSLLVNNGQCIMGAESKGGLAIIVSVLEAIVKSSASANFNISVALTPDEQIGKGTKHLDLDKLSADWAYTVNGGGLGEYSFENFNAASATVSFKGNVTHPAYAKGKLINALTLASEFEASMPHDKKPETTSEREGFYFLTNMTGNISEASLNYEIREFDLNIFNEMKTFLINKVKESNHSLPKDCVSLEIKDAYINMASVIENIPLVNKLASYSYAANDVEQKVIPIRGGTDGAFLAESNLACPNIFVGGYNYHSLEEFISIDSMCNSAQVIITMLLESDELLKTA